MVNLRTNMPTVLTIICVILIIDLKCGHSLSLASQYFEKFCGKTLDIGNKGDTMSSGTDWLSNSYSANLTCQVNMQTMTNRKILLTWTEFDVEKDANGKCRGILKIYDGPNTLSPMLNSQKQCGFFQTYPAIASAGNTLTMHLTTFDTGNGDHNFELVYTSFATGTCGKEEWKCDNGRCIHNDIAYDFNDNCGDGSDQDNIGELVSGLLKWGIGVLIAIIIGIIVGGILLCVCCGCIIYHCCCKRVATPSQQTTVVHAPPAADPGIQMKGYDNNGYGQNGTTPRYGNKI